MSNKDPNQNFIAALFNRSSNRSANRPNNRTSIYPNGSTHSKAIGDNAEALAQHYLQRQGCSTVARNYRCRFGEIDLILRHGETLVFVEVRMRRNSRYGSAAETVTRDKQRKIISAARHFLMTQKINAACRFDVVEITANNKNGNFSDRSDDSQLTINWIQSAFYAQQ